MNTNNCESCIKRKTEYCPNSSECNDIKHNPHYQSKTMILEENKQLRAVLKDIEKTCNAYAEDYCYIDGSTSTPTQTNCVCNHILELIHKVADKE